MSSQSIEQLSRFAKLEFSQSETRFAFPIRQAFNFAWPIFKKRFGLFTAVLLTIFGAWITLEIVVIAGQRFGILLWIVAHLAFLIFVAGMEVGFLRDASPYLMGESRNLPTPLRI